MSEVVRRDLLASEKMADQRCGVALEPTPRELGEVVAEDVVLIHERVVEELTLTVCPTRPRFSIRLRTVAMVVDARERGSASRTSDTVASRRSQRTRISAS